MRMRWPRDGSSADLELTGAGRQQGHQHGEGLGDAEPNVRDVHLVFRSGWRGFRYAPNPEFDLHVIEATGGYSAR